MKKTISILLATLLLITCFGCGSSENEEASKKKYNIAYITDTSGKKDSVNRQIIEGINESFDGLDMNLDIKEPSNSDDYSSVALKVLSSSKNYNLVIANSTSVCTALLADHNEYEDIKLGFIGYADSTNHSMSIKIEKQEGAFLAGALAALTTKSNKVAYVGAYENRNTEYLYGFLSGVKYVNKKVKVFTTYTGSFINATNGAHKADKLRKQGVDTFFTVCGAGAIGVNTIASKYDLKVIDSDLYNETNSEIKLGEMYINHKSAVTTLCEAVIYDSYNTKVNHLGVTESVMDLSIFDENIKDKDKVNKKIDLVKKNISTGKIKVPMSKKAYNAFK